MKITTHGDYLINLNRLAFVNCQLVREDDGFTLIDTGLAGSAEGIVAAARQFGMPIRRILLTHDHIDHVGSLDALHKLLPDAEVAISARDARFLAGERSLDPDEPQDQLRGGYVTCSTRPAHLLKAGEMVGSLEVIASPGHTPGHVSFFDHRDKTLYAGDAYTTKAGISTGGTLRLLFPFTAMATWHKPTGIHSAEMLVALRPNRLAVGHGKVLENPVSAMEWAIEDAKRHLGSKYASQKTS